MGRPITSNFCRSRARDEEWNDRGEYGVTVTQSGKDDQSPDGGVGRPLMMV